VSLQICLDERRVNVILPTHRACISQALRGVVDGADDVPLGFLLRFRGSELAQVLGAVHGAGPGAEVLRSDVGTAGFSQVVVDVHRLDLLTLAIVVQVLEENLTGQLVAALHDARDVPVGDGHGVLYSALAAELEAQLGAIDRDVTSAQRCEPVRLVVARQILRPHADERTLQQPHHGREHFVTRESLQEDVALDSLPDLPDDFAEVEEALELRALAISPETGMVAVLLAPARVTRGDLEVSVLVRADPDVGPRRRDHERAEALNRVLGDDKTAIGVVVREAATAALAADARDDVADVTQPGRDRGIFGLWSSGDSRRRFSFKQNLESVPFLAAAGRPAESIAIKESSAV
jgi:hypothetical protein